MNDKHIKVHMIGNAHLDPAWLWRWPEGIQEGISTFRSALDRIRETGEFVFTRGEAWLFEQIEECAPELFAEISQRVAEGRIRLVNGWVVQADCNLPSGESFVRQALYGKEYFRRKFGMDVKIGYSVDAFGHNASLPQILRKCGYNSYIFTRPLSENSVGFKVEKSLPSSIFWWEGADGSRVLAYHIPCWAHGSYGIHIDDLGEHIRTTIAGTPEDVHHAMCMYGVGNHGGGPTKRQIQYINDHSGDFPNARLVFSHPERFLEELGAEADKLPVVRDELNPTMVGCYTSSSEVKKLNRQTESILIAAERWCTVAALIMRRMPYPAEELRDAWKLLLFNQFHDILAGTSTPEVYEDARDMYGHARNAARRQLGRAIRLIASEADTSGEGLPIMVFNPCAWRRKEQVQVEPYLGAKNEHGWKEEEFRVVDKDGSPVDAQLVKGSDNTGGIPAWCFVADAPPLGYSTYRIIRSNDGKPLCRADGTLLAEKTRIRNRFLDLKIDPETGWISSIRDLARDLEILRGPANVPVVLKDESDSWGVWVSAYRDEIARIRFSEFRVVEEGPLRARIWMQGNLGRSRISTTITLARDSDILFFSTRLEWMEKHTMLKMAFPLNLEDPRIVCETPYGSIARKCDGAESVMQSWVMMSGKHPAASGASEYGVSLVNDGKYAYDALGSELRLTALRCIPYAYTKSYDLTRHPSIPYLDYGLQEFGYALKVGTGDVAEVQRLAESFNNPLVLTAEAVHCGRLAPAESFVESTAVHTNIEVLKESEDGSGICLRLLELVGRAEKFEIGLGAGAGRRGIKVEVGPHEIRTLVLRRRGRGFSCEETDMLERKPARD